jgi:hypothetical protein
MKSAFVKYASIVGLSVVVFAAMQVLLGDNPCYDCGAYLGFPFSLRQEGTYWSEGRTLWLAFIADLAIAFSIGITARWPWHRIRNPKSPTAAK